MRKIPRELWPAGTEDELRLEVWKDLDFLAQLFEVPMPGVFRISVNRTVRDGKVRWVDGITWDDLMAVKRAIGFGAAWAVEVFPPDAQVVNVANMRHLWVLPEKPAYAWLARPVTERSQSGTGRAQ